MIRWAADALLILLAGFLLLFFFAVIDGIVGALWDAWTSRKARRVDRAHWFSPAELEEARARELDKIRSEQKQAFMDGQVTRYLARKRW